MSKMIAKASRSAGPTAAAKNTREEVKGTEYFSIYANDVRVQTSIWDVRLKFGEVDGDVDDRLSIKVLGEVRLSPPLAKALTVLLIKQLQQYEAKHGPIPVNPELPSDALPSVS
jgi:hypothetical protein